MARNANKNYDFKLPKFEIIPALDAQSAGQKVEWYITKFNIDKLWNISTGEGVKIAVLDTGVQLDHPDIKDNIIDSKNFVLPSKSANSTKAKHGTHVSGIICAKNNDIGTVGVAHNAKLLIGAVLGDNGAGNFKSVANGIRWAVDSKADLISMSLGCPNAIQEVRKAIQYAYNKGIPVFCAAGNAGSATTLFYPAAYPESISIAATDLSDKRASFSNVGKNLDFMAPGVNILSCIPVNWMGTMNGSSQAAPWITGIAALILSYTRNNKTNIKLDCVEDYRKILKACCNPINDKSYQGSGLFDTNKFLNLIK